jgi:hypothetical protein
VPTIPPSDPLSYYFASCDEIFGVREGTPYSMSGQRDYTRQFQVIVKDKNLNPPSVRLCPGLPLPGSPYATGDSWDDYALLVDMPVKEQGPARDDWSIWIVTCHYSTQIPTRGGPGGGTQNNPDQEFPEVAYDFEDVEYAPLRDRDDKPYFNSARQPFMPAKTFSGANLVLNITRNELNVNKDNLERYANAVNDDTFLGTEPGCVQCRPPKATQKWRGKFRFWSVSYRLRFGRRKPGGFHVSWQPHILDAGLEELIVGAPGDPAKVRHAPIRHEGTPVRNPRCLNGFGAEALPDATGVVTPHYLDFNEFLELSFRDLLVKGLG